MEVFRWLVLGLYFITPGFMGLGLSSALGDQIHPNG